MRTTSHLHPLPSCRLRSMRLPTPTPALVTLPAPSCLQHSESRHLGHLAGKRAQTIVRRTPWTRGIPVLECMLSTYHSPVVGILIGSAERSRPASPPHLNRPSVRIGYQQEFGRPAKNRGSASLILVHREGGPPGRICSGPMRNHVPIEYWGRALSYRQTASGAIS
jgi:hypothetical protein